jgi:hypothetical protein
MFVILKLLELTTMEVFKRFVVIIQVVFEIHYLCKSLQEDFKRQLVINVEKKVVWDVCKFGLCALLWKFCLVAYPGQFSSILDVIVD